MYQRAAVILWGVMTPEEAAVAATTNVQPWPLVRQGDRDHPVRTLQRLLRQRGHSVVVDGIFGPKTDAAVRAFQTAAHLAVDGIVGPKTWGALIVTVRRGSQGEAVKGVQEEAAFRDLSGNPPSLAIDGIFGPKTEAWVRGFQEAVEIAVDGIVGPVTWQALISGMLSL
jgi:peptidoglycan hydrolase-like protein with peptidoglycan-binding domain